MYNLTSGLELITNKHPRPEQHNIDDEGVYRSLVAQTRVKSFPNRTAGDLPHVTWKWKQLLKKMVVSGEMIGEESRDTDGTDSVESDTASVGDTESSTEIASPVSTRKGWEDVPSSPARTRPYGKAKNAKDRGAPYKGYKGDGAVYLPGDTNGLTQKLHLLATEFFAGNTTVRNELVHVLNAFLRWKQLTRKEYVDITARLAASL